ncbi:Putative serine/threonine-protein kinase [Toxocara canis]|uniref:Putative serine/threonine-protein kinase n=1 Tax=Toxocara canis TaxID=6265 RepID=A0A0B2UUM6_TOXCA|nr:Putative serine/threonine-protein kinase [Toxocara canis]
MEKRLFEKGCPARPPRSYAPFISSIRYASRACHDRSDCARKDDLESWLYMSVEFYQINILSWRMMTNLAEIRKEKDAFMSERGVTSIPIHYLQSLYTEPNNCEGSTLKS